MNDKENEERTTDSQTSQIEQRENETYELSESEIIIRPYPLVIRQKHPIIDVDEINEQTSLNNPIVISDDVAIDVDENESTQKALTFVDMHQKGLTKRLNTRKPRLYHF
ncbi:hypothetical protein EIN_406020 [Entamoeba invadens IP1]|uniref:Uncharacterized protein n=1 Tax=Entamoeba invadens IP1 TaxID=370355 RepID=A0A0A1U6V7_ENTIV|nr:hypothetical protein EIN_406020 [Entamoeba invadens IP1]ELP90148.1 hypothetical protein EIN_406020 [Entamoeba invadens IP1]|eukprot:XP_004256919.1 hypothetical protein EIN_406020 [Entamoeba invadens IP1]